MGQVAKQRADLVIVTNDNPRSEDPLADHRGHPAREREWRSRSTPTGAPRSSRDRAGEPGDVVVIAGKGHEQGQDIGGVVTRSTTARSRGRRSGWRGGRRDNACVT